jgi:hypothetical protein
VKALSFWQPWCEVILEHGKRIENRERWSACNYRGPILIHAAKTFGGAVAFHETVKRLVSMGAVEGLPLCLNRRGEWAPDATANLGGIVGRANIVGVVKDSSDIARQGLGDQLRWWHGGFALVLDNVQRLPFVPWKGKQGFFEVPDDYAMRWQL